jgi:hypothetical protein
MSNETTIVRFDFGDRPTEVRTDLFSQISTHMAEVFSDAVSPLGDLRVDLYHALSPRKGSIEFHLIAKIDVLFDEGLVADRTRTNRKLIEKATLGVGIAAFLWGAVFGDNGAVHGALKASPQAKPSSEDVRAQVAESLLAESPIARGRLANLVEVAKRSGADRVEIQLPDENAVIIFDSTSRMHPGLIGRQSPPARELPGDGLVSLRLVGRPISVELNGMRRLALIAEIAHSRPNMLRRVVVVWASEREPSFDGNLQVIVEKLQSEMLVPLEPVPLEFETIEGTYLVRGVAEFR